MPTEKYSRRSRVRKSGLLTTDGVRWKRTYDTVYGFFFFFWSLIYYTVIGIVNRLVSSLNKTAQITCFVGMTIHPRRLYTYNVWKRTNKCFSIERIGVWRITLSLNTRKHKCCINILVRGVFFVMCIIKIYIIKKSVYDFFFFFCYIMYYCFANLLIVRKIAQIVNVTFFLIKKKKKKIFVVFG